jgi:hypothetical protein
MPTLYLDFENGNDNHGGTSFATLASGTDGRITTATFSSATASFPNNGSLIGQYLSIFNGTIYAVYNITAWVSATSLTIAAISGGTALANQAVDRQYYIGGRWKNFTTGATAERTIPGDTIRIMGSPAPTSLGQNGVWTSQALQAEKSITAATNATPIAVTVTAHGYATGDTVVISSVSGNTNAIGTWEITSTGANTFTLNGSTGNAAYTGGGGARLRNNTVVRLSSAVTQNIASTGFRTTAWTASANVTTALTSGKESRYGEQISVGAAFTTGLAAYWSTGALDLSGYQQVSFWIRQASGTVGAAGSIDLRLCSDAAGVTAVNTISIPSLAVTGRWMPVTVDLATALGSSIQSIALYVNTDNGAQIFLLSNIIACKASSAADSLTLTSLIGKNTTGETFWGIQSINGTRVMLDRLTNDTPDSGQVLGYYGTSETVTTWKREAYKAGPYSATSTNFCQTVSKNGTQEAPIIYSFGWDRTNMLSQSLETWVDGVNGNGQGISFQGNFQQANNFAFTRFGSSFSGSTGNYGIVIDGRAYNNGTYSKINSTSYVNLNFACASLNVGPHGMGNSKFGKVYSSGGLAVDSKTLGPNQRLTVDLRNCGNVQGMLFTQPTAGGLLENSIFEGTVTAFTYSGCHGLIYCKNCLFLDANELTPGSAGNTTISVYSHDHDQVPGNHKIFYTIGRVSTATDQRHTNSGISWKVQPTESYANQTYPLIFSLAKVACAANSAVTIKAWMRRDNAGLTMRLVCKGGQIAGVASDVTASVTTTNAWEELTLVFTPTEIGVVEITAESYGGTTFSGWVDDLTISQA